MPRVEECLNLRKSWFQASHYKRFTLLLLFYLQPGIVCTEIHRFVEYTPEKCFNSFVQSAVDARRQGDENPNSSVVAETMKLLVKRSYGYQTMDRSQHTVTKKLSDEKTHAAINSKLFKKLDHVKNALYEVELVKAQIEQKNQSLSSSLFFNMQKSECWNCITTFSRNSET